MGILLAGSARVWTIKFRAGPDHEPYYHPSGMVTSLGWPQGDVSKIEEPSDLSYNQWIEVQSYQNSADRASGTITVYDKIDRSQVYELIKTRCAFDVQIHMGICEDPRDFNYGWDKIAVMEDDRMTDYTPSDMGAQEGANQDKRTEEAPYSGRSIYYILRMTYREVAKDEVGEEVIAVDVCDLITCGECEGSASDGCQKVYAVTNAGTASPGVKPQVIITTDQFGDNAIIERWVTTIGIGENASDAACVGPYFVVLSADGEEIHYAPTRDMEDSVETWAGVTTGIVAGAGPNAIWNYSPLSSFIAGLSGYIYLMKNPADGLTVLDAASLVTDDLNDIDGFNNTNVSAVGDAGAFLYTTDGYTFSAGTAPAGPTDLYAVAYRNEQEIWVGGDDGNLYVTTDYGDHWTTKALPVSVTQVDKIYWFNETVGMVAARNATPRGYIFRTIDGGYSWYTVPESNSLSLPNADGFNAIVGCQNEVNKAFIGGLADNGGDGILLKGSDY